MPVIPSHFHPPYFLHNGHVQTIVPVLLQRRLAISARPERLELEDGDFLDLAWLAEGSGRLVIISHGLEGCADNDYIRGMAVALRSAGWDVLAWNFRGCGSEPNRLARFYHSGETGDLASVIRHAGQRYARIALIGFSLGGNVTLKYLGEPGLHEAVCAGIGISVPVDLAASARALDQRWGNRIYLQRFMATLIAKVEAKALRFPEQLDASGARKIRTFQEFDDRYTARLHGFRDANDYWTQSSARQYLPKITVPTLLLNAQNDPFLTPESFPVEEAEGNPQVFLEMPESGGHVGFLDLKNGLQRWSERRAVQFLQVHCANPMVRASE
ncbi:YheT family hydrolase [Verrucomicrobiota bacterium sgz303538]